MDENHFHLYYHWTDHDDSIQIMVRSRLGRADAARSNDGASDLHQDDREALRKILSEVEKAINAQDIEGIIAQMHPDRTVTWWNAKISRGHEEIRAYYGS